MDEPVLYRRIADQIRLEILEGRLKPGDRLPAIRELTGTWHCTQGTVQRAYQELAQQGLVVSRAGRGTMVAGSLDPTLLQTQGPLRRASLVHKAEQFLLEALTAGFALSEIQQAVDLAMDRWRSLQAETAHPLEAALRFAGSHDAAVAWLSSHFDEITPGTELQLVFTGSLGGLIALAEGRADLAGCHLWDPETNTYNLPFVKKLFPGRRMAAVRLAERRLGLILPPGNPLGITRLEDLARGGVRFINRQPGSGTRVWLDEEFRQRGVNPTQVEGYADEKQTHFEVARVVAEGHADVGLGLEAAATAFRLDFLFQVEESYDLVTSAEVLESPMMRALVDWLASASGRQRIGSLVGYDARQAGTIQLI